MTYLSQLYDFLKSTNNNLYLVASFIILFAVTFVLRMIACTAFRTCLFAARLDLKEIKDKNDIKKIKNNFLKRVASDYIKNADKNASRIPLEKIVEKHASALSFFGWRYTNIQSLAEALESGLPVIGFIMAVAFFDDAFIYGSLTAAGFILTRLMASLFDTGMVKNLLTEDIVIYIEREIGQFYAIDNNAAVTRLQTVLLDYVNRQTEAVKSAVESLGKRLEENTIKNVADMRTGAEQLVVSMKQPIENWAKIYENFNTIIQNLDISSQHLSEHMNVLTTSIQAIDESNTALVNNQETFIEITKYIERNQAELEQSLHSYESALQSITRQMGDGLGTFIQMYAQNTAQVMNDTLQANINRIIHTNNGLVQRVITAFEDMRKQNKDISSHLLSLHEKLEIIEKGRRL